MKAVLLILIVGLLSGCSHETKHDVNRDAPFVDGHLYASHFDGGELNSRGRAKIDVIPAGGPVILVIHPTRATDRQVFVRRARDVKAYANQRGLTDAQVRFNPDYDDTIDTFDPVGTASACVADDNR